MTLSIASTICITLRSRDYNSIHPTSWAYPLLLKASFACCSEMTFVPVNLGKILFKMASWTSCPFGGVSMTLSATT